MRARRLAHFPFLRILVATCFAALTTACSIYDGDLSDPTGDSGDLAGSGGSGVGGTSGGTGKDGSAGSAGGTGGSSGGEGGARRDGSIDGDVAGTDVSHPPHDDAPGDGANDALEAASPSEANPTDTPPLGDITPADDVGDASTTNDANDAGPALNDGASDAPRPPDADATTPPRDADAGTPDVVDSGPTGPQILPMHGTSIEKPDAGGPFDSRCASDEVVTGFIGRAGVQTDAIASTCSNLIGGVLSSPRNLPLNGNLTGGNSFTVTCPANHVAVGIVGRYGHNTMWKEDVTTMIGVVCRPLAGTTTQIVTIAGQPALDPGYTSFREDCTGGRYLTDISGRTDSNVLGYTVQQVGGECDAR
jgi:hypothetical protein